MVENLFYEKVLESVTSDNNYHIIYNFTSKKRKIFVDDTLLRLFEYDLGKYNYEKRKFKNFENEDFSFYSLFPTLVVKDEEKFNEKINEYIETILKWDENNKTKDAPLDKRIKYYLTILMLNATTYDFQNPIQYIDRVNEFYNDKTLENLQTSAKHYIATLNNNIEYKIIKNLVSDETPYAFVSQLTNNIKGTEVIYEMPRLCYGINEENGEKVVYIYSLQMSKEKKSGEINNEYRKKVNRFLYKINKGIPEDDEILNVTHNSIVALTIFMSVMHNEGINKIKVPSALPIRLNAARLKHEKTSEGLLRMSDDTETYDMIVYNEKIILKDYTNMIDKFIQNFMRLDYHFSNLNIKSFPTENNENSLILDLRNLECNSEILEDICNTISESYVNSKRNIK